jgi:hypothetical protein
MATILKATNQPVKNLKGADKFFVLENLVDLALVATGDVVQALLIAAGTKVLDVIVKVVTPCGLVATATVGDGTSAAGFDASTNLNATAGTLTNGLGGTDALMTAGGKLYTADDTIDLTCTIAAGPIVAGKVLVKALCVDCN